MGWECRRESGAGGGRFRGDWRRGRLAGEKAKPRALLSPPNPLSDGATPLPTSTLSTLRLPRSRSPAPPRASVLACRTASPFDVSQYTCTPASNFAVSGITSTATHRIAKRIIC